MTSTMATTAATASTEGAGVRVRWLGRIDYMSAWDEQRRVRERVAAGTEPDTVLLLEHPSVYTAGKRTKPADRPVDGSPVIDVDRGGEITWHGPGQLVGYPILTLPGVREGRPVDVVAYVRRVERMLMDVCAEFGLDTIQVPGRSGVWVAADGPGATETPGAPGGPGATGGPKPTEVPGPMGTATVGRPERKIAAIGVRVVRGVTMHGFALNCDPDMSAYDKIVACGLPDAGVTSLSLELGRDVALDEVLPVVERHLPTLLG